MYVSEHALTHVCVAGFLLTVNCNHWHPCLKIKLLCKGKASKNIKKASLPCYTVTGSKYSKITTSIYLFLFFNDCSEHFEIKYAFLTFSLVTSLIFFIFFLNAVTEIKHIHFLSQNIRHVIRDLSHCGGEEQKVSGHLHDVKLFCRMD